MAHAEDQRSRYFTRQIAVGRSADGLLHTAGDMEHGGDPPECGAEVTPFNWRLGTIAEVTCLTCGALVAAHYLSRADE